MQTKFKFLKYLINFNDNIFVWREMQESDHGNAINGIFNKNKEKIMPEHAGIKAL